MKVNDEKCGELARLIRTLEVPEDREEATLVLSTLPRPTRADFLFSLVAICHQTTPVSGSILEGDISGIRRRGWDFLSHALLKAVACDPRIVTPEGLVSFDSGLLREILQTADKSARISDAEGRARLLRNLGSSLRAWGMSSVDEVYLACDRTLVAPDGTGILQRLAKTAAYSDPVQKKSLFFCMLMKNHEIWKFRDAENLGPPVDYHEIRGHLRLGTVIVGSDLLEEIASDKVTYAADIELRRAVFEAIMSIAAMTGLTPACLHYFFGISFAPVACAPNRTVQHAAAAVGFPFDIDFRLEHLSAVA